jgi:hypothetical protein
VWWKSVAVAPSRPQRVYVTGYQVAGVLADGGQSPPTTHLQISDDSGTSWRESPLTGVSFGAMPLIYVLGVDPGNPDIVLASSSLANAPGDRLYRSTDGGTSWTDVLDTSSPIIDLSIETTGTVLVATLGTGTAGAGPFQSTDHGASFSPMIGAPQLACTSPARRRCAVGCGAGGEPDSAVATTGTAPAGPLFSFVELAGPLDCRAGTGEHDTAAACGPRCRRSCHHAPPPAASARRRRPPPPPKNPAALRTGTAPDAVGSIALLVRAVRPRPAPPQWRATLATSVSDDAPALRGCQLGLDAVAPARIAEDDAGPSCITAVGVRRSAVSIPAISADTEATGTRGGGGGPAEPTASATRRSARDRRRRR